MRPVPVPAGRRRRRGSRPRGRGRAVGLLAAGEQADVEHAQDAIAGAALLWLRAERGAGAVVRTVHHVDASGLPGLDETERASIQGADACICPSATWADRLRAEYGVEATVVPGASTPRASRRR